MMCSCRRGSERFLYDAAYSRKHNGGQARPLNDLLENTMTRQRKLAMPLALLSLLTVGPMIGSNASAADITKLKALAAEKWTVPDLGLELARIPAGSFTMGSPADEPARRDDESQHEVKIARPFYMGVYEVTQGEYYRLMIPDFDHDRWTYDRGPLHAGGAFFYRTGGDLNPRHPMESVTWDSAVAFCRKLTEAERKAKRLPDGYVFRLPTEAEWEYACRAGTTGRMNVDAEGGYDGLKKFAFVGDGRTSPVGNDRQPNAWGLYDMHGNVYEWCLDWYGPYPADKTTDPTGPAEGTKRVARGGCFYGCDPTKQDPEVLVYPFVRSASRYPFSPNVRGYAILGFRVVLAPGGGSKQGVNKSR